MRASAGHPRSRRRGGPRPPLLPTTALGRWAAALGAASVPLLLGATAVPRGAALGLVCGIAGGTLAVAAITREHERAATVFAALAPLAAAVAFLLAELIGGDH
jgi:hypothetical protein